MSPSQMRCLLCPGAQWLTLPQKPEKPCLAPHRGTNTLGLPSSDSAIFGAQDAESEVICSQVRNLLTLHPKRGRKLDGCRPLKTHSGKSVYGPRLTTPPPMPLYHQEVVTSTATSGCQRSNQCSLLEDSSTAGLAHSPRGRLGRGREQSLGQRDARATPWTSPPSLFHSLGAGT